MRSQAERYAIMAKGLHNSSTQKKINNILNQEEYSASEKISKIAEILLKYFNANDCGLTNFVDDKTKEFLLIKKFFSNSTDEKSILLDLATFLENAPKNTSDSFDHDAFDHRMKQHLELAKSIKNLSEEELDLLLDEQFIQLSFKKSQKSINLNENEDKKESNFNHQFNQFQTSETNNNSSDIDKNNNSYNNSKN